jgi:hypothetical protein
LNLLFRDLPELIGMIMGTFGSDHAGGSPGAAPANFDGFGAGWRSRAYTPSSQQKYHSTSSKLLYIRS